MKKHTALLSVIAIITLLFSSNLQAGRYYDAEIGRFTQPDPALQKINPNELAKLHNGKLLSTSPYAYGLNNPLRYVDPDGNIVWDVIDAASFGHSAYTLYKNPSWENAGWLALDAVGLLPIIPAVGSIKLVDKALDASKSFTKGTSVIGPRNTYRQFAKDIGANFLNVSDEAWTWAKNEKYLQGIVERGDDVIFSGKFDPKLLDPDTPLAREINYLTEHGYQWTDDFSRLVKQ